MVRLDEHLVQQGLFPTRSQAQAAVLAGQVRVNGQPARKAGQPVGPGDRVEREEGPRYVSRGGLKLEEALRVFDLAVSGRRALDVGASTGGFTDCLLAHGAEHVVAVDVGYGQLAWRLRQDPRVTVMERTNARSLTAANLPYRPTLVTMDASFISLTLLLPPLWALMEPGGEMVVLIKPQFEAGRTQVGKRGVVRDPQVHREVLLRVARFAAEEGHGMVGLCHSPLPGPEGNIEFLAQLRQGSGRVDPREVESVVEEAHRALRRDPR